MHNQLKPPTAGLDGAQLVIRTQCRRHRGDQLVVRQLRLGLVIVDVILQQRVQFGGIPRLPCAQHDARGPVTCHVADEVHQLQPGVVRFHDHVQQHQRNVAVGQQQIAGLRSRMRVNQLDAPVKQHRTFESKLRCPVHIGIIVNDHHRPRAAHGHGQRVFHPTG